jgi:AraC-like DNA-binding protein
VFVMTQVLPAVPNSYSDLLEGYVARARPPRLQAVLTHMETHADPPLTPGELARVGCMSVRSLHATFQHELGLSPMAHLRRIRLDRVHAELLRAGHADERIGDIAVRWASSTRAGSPGNTRTGSASSRPTRPAAPDPAQAGSTQIGDDQATSPSTWNTRA